MHTRTDKTDTQYTGALANCVDGSYSSLLHLPAVVSPPLLPPAVLTTCTDKTNTQHKHRRTSRPCGW